MYIHLTFAATAATLRPYRIRPRTHRPAIHQDPASSFRLTDCENVAELSKSIAEHCRALRITAKAVQCIADCSKSIAEQCESIAEHYGALQSMVEHGTALHSTAKALQNTAEHCNRIGLSPGMLSVGHFAATRPRLEFGARFFGGKGRSSCKEGSDGGE